MSLPRLLLLSTGGAGFRKNTVSVSFAGATNITETRRPANAAIAEPVEVLNGKNTKSEILPDLRHDCYSSNDDFPLENQRTVRFMVVIAFQQEKACKKQAEDISLLRSFIYVGRRLGGAATMCVKASYKGWAWGVV